MDHVVAVAVEATATALRAKVDAAVPDGASLWLAVDLRGSEAFDLSLQLVPDVRLRSFPSGTERVPTATVTRTDVFTVVVPWSELGEPDKGFVRVRASTWRGDTPLDPGLAAAVVLARDQDVVGARPVVALPLVGRWYVVQGPGGRTTHGDAVAYDLSVRDDAHEPRPAGATSVSNAYAWGRPLVATEEVTVVAVRDGNPDSPLDHPGVEANAVTVRFASGLELTASHLRASAPVAVGDTVLAGTTIGTVGSSGRSTGPHAHLVWSKDGQPVPVAFGPVAVGLHARAALTAVDGGWVPEEGWFVEAR